MNNKKQQNIQSEKTLTEIFKYNAGGEASEYHIIIHSTKPEDTYEEQLNAVLNTYDYLLTQELKGELPSSNVISLVTLPIRQIHYWH